MVKKKGFFASTTSNFQAVQAAIIGVIDSLGGVAP
jgi:hypothetical protein